MNAAKLTEWVEPQKQMKDQGIWLKMIFWAITLMGSTIVGGGAFFMHHLWAKVETVDSNLALIRESSRKSENRLVMVEIVTKRLADKQGVDLEDMERLRDAKIKFQ